MIEKENVWSFVEKYYPDYEHSNDIAHNDDLCRLVDNEFERDDSADELLQRQYGGDREENFLEIEADFKRSLCEIYEKSIQNFLNTYDFEDNNQKCDIWKQKVDDDLKSKEDF